MCPRWAGSRRAGPRRACCLPSRGLARQLRVALTAGKRRSLASEGLKAGCCCCRTVGSESKSLRAAW